VSVLFVFAVECHKWCSGGCWGPRNTQCRRCLYFTDMTNASGSFTPQWVKDPVLGLSVPGYNVTTCVDKCDTEKGWGIIVLLCPHFKCCINLLAILVSSKCIICLQKYICVYHGTVASTVWCWLQKNVWNVRCKCLNRHGDESWLIKLNQPSPWLPVFVLLCIARV